MQKANLMHLASKTNVVHRQQINVLFFGDCQKVTEFKVKTQQKK